VLSFLSDKLDNDEAVQALLTDKLWAVAVQSITTNSSSNSSKFLEAKQAATATLCQKHASDKLSEEEILRCIDSIADNEVCKQFFRHDLFFCSLPFTSSPLLLFPVYVIVMLEFEGQELLYQHTGQGVFLLLSTAIIKTIADIKRLQSEHKASAEQN
jgi:hypothetical protein